ncbi:MAG TPA: glycosyltransferase family A protein [Candidatus Acidoferrales bacterium]
MIESTSNLTAKTAQAPVASHEKRREWKPPSYVLMTAAHNEEADIANTIESVLAQTVLPRRWLIVSDNSTDRTNEIVRSYADKHDFIRFLTVTRPPGHSFAAKVVALRTGAHLLQGVSYDFIGNMDADLTVSPTYFEELMGQFEINPRLGLAGGFVYEEVNGQFVTRGANRTHSVAHAAQLVRRECYEAFGGYAILEYGGEDWHAQTSVRSMGWDAESIPELKIYHHRPTGAGSGKLRSHYRLGKLDYSFGTYLIFETIKCAIRLPHKPFLVGAIVRMSGFLDSFIRREPFLIPPELASFLRKEQKDRMLSYFRGPASRAKSQAAAENSGHSA